MLHSTREKMVAKKERIGSLEKSDGCTDLLSYMRTVEVILDHLCNFSKHSLGFFY